MFPSFEWTVSALSRLRERNQNLKYFIAKIFRQNTEIRIFSFILRRDVIFSLEASILPTWEYRFSLQCLSFPEKSQLRFPYPEIRNQEAQQKRLPALQGMVQQLQGLDLSLLRTCSWTEKFSINTLKIWCDWTNVTPLANAIEGFLCSGGGALRTKSSKLSVNTYRNDCKPAGMTTHSKTQRFGEKLQQTYRYCCGNGNGRYPGAFGWSRHNPNSDFVQKLAFFALNRNWINMIAMKITFPSYRCGLKETNKKL